MGESRLNLKVLDLLGSAGQATMAVLGAYPRWVTGLQFSISGDIRARVSLLERFPQRVAQCEEALARMLPPKKLHAVFQQEVSWCFFHMELNKVC